MSLVFNVAMELDGSGGANTDITAYVKNVAVSVGKRNPLAVTPDAGSCRITLNNADKRFSPENSSGPYYGYLTPKRQVTVKVSSQFWFVGWVASFSPTAGQFRERECTVECFDLIGLLQKSTIYSPVRLNMTGDQLVAGIVNTALGAPQNTLPLNWSGLPPNNSTIQIVYNGVTTTYKFVSGSPTNAYDVKADTIRNSIKNFISAIAQTEGSGTTYVAGAPPTNIEAIENSSTYALMRAKARRLYDFGEAAGTTATDEGAEAQNGAYVGGVTLAQTGCASGDPDTAALFNGSTGKCTIPTFSMDNSSFSIEAWVKPLASPPAFQTVYHSNGGGGSNQNVAIYIVGNGQLLYRFGSSQDLVSFAGVITFGGGWQHIVCTYNSITKTRTMYVNGAQANTDTGQGPIQSTSTPVCQWGNDGGTIWMNGSMDKCGLYNVELSAAEVTARYNSPSTSIGVTLRHVVPGATGCAFTASSSTGNITTSGTATGGVDYPQSVVSYDVGVQTFPRAGQNWNGINAMAAIDEVTRSENGRFWVARGGVVFWHNRQWWFQRTTATVVQTLNGEPQSHEGKSGLENIANIINVVVNPQDTQSSGVVAQSTTPFQVPGKGSFTVKLPYVDPVTAKGGSAKNLILPLVASTDWVANEQKDNSGTDYTTVNPGYVTFSYKVLANEIQITVYNAALGPLYMTKFQVRGQLVTSYNPIPIEVRDDTSVKAYVPLMLRVDLALSQDVNYATVLGQYLLNKYKDPKYRLTGVDMGVVGLKTGIQPVAINIDDVVQISENQLGITNQKYLVIGLSMQLDVSGGTITFQYQLERLDDITYWVLDDTTYSVLGSTTRLAV